MDKPKMINRIITFDTITFCDQTLIRSRINWDQKWHLFTPHRIVISYHWDNYSFFTGSFCIYPQFELLKKESIGLFCCHFKNENVQEWCLEAVRRHIKHPYLPDIVDFESFKTFIKDNFKQLVLY